MHVTIQQERDDDVSKNRCKEIDSKISSILRVYNLLNT